MFALLPLAIGAFFAFGVGSSAIPFVVLNTLFWLPVLVFGVLERGVLKVGPQGVVWIRGVGRLSFRREVPVDAWTWSRVVVLRHFGWAVEVVGRNGGIRGWLAECLPELSPKYKTLMRYKAMAIKLRQVTGTEDPVPTEKLLEMPQKKEVLELFRDFRMTFSSLEEGLSFLLAPDMVFAERRAVTVRVGKQASGCKQSGGGKRVRKRRCEGARSSAQDGRRDRPRML